MSAAPNAILAVNSLDRYAGQPVVNYNRVNVSLIVGSTLVVINNGFLTVGAAVLGVGIAPGTLVVAVSPLGINATISLPAILTTTNFITQAVTTNSALQPVSNSLNSQYSNGEPPAYNFTIQSPGALIYGYFEKLIVSQIQIQYNIPTISLGRNDTIYISDGPRALDPAPVTIPYGFYTPTELAATLEVLIAATPFGTVANIQVSFDKSLGFVFESVSVPPRTFYFPDIPELQVRPGFNLSGPTINNILRTYRTLGINRQNSYVNVPFTATSQVSGDYPTFIYTPYIDICSSALTNYQRAKDATTNPDRLEGLIARIYISGVGNPQITTDTTALGSAPFILTVDLNSPKVIRWERNVAVYSIDLQAIDQYGDYIPGADYGYSTEFQMTLLCVEGE